LYEDFWRHSHNLSLFTVAVALSIATFGERLHSRALHVPICPNLANFNPEPEEDVRHVRAPTLSYILVKTFMLIDSLVGESE